MTRPLPPRDDLLRLAQAAIFNARDLLDSARVLLDAGRPPIAHALATLALEEVGKSHLCVLSLVPSPDILELDFWREWRSHAGKLRWARGVLGTLINEPPPGPLAEMYSRLTDESRSDHLRKLRGFYVDYSDGEIELPDIISAEEARELIDDVQASIDFVIPAWGDIDVAARMRLLDEHTASLAGFLNQIIEVLKADPDGAFRDIVEKLQSDIRGDTPREE